jgi:3',5'-cyclic AMP phosphodiesterase CpdA
MPRIAHISDLHFGRIGEDAEQLLLEDLNAMTPDYLLVSGDIT